jgi:hypothetical protein
VPPPYAGETLTSVAEVQSKTGPQAGGEEAVVMLWSQYRTAADTAWVNGSDAKLDLVQVGDQIRFNSQGHYYSITALDITGSAPNRTTTGRITIRAVNTTLVVTQPLNMALSFQIFRQPIPSAAADLELPESVVIDLGHSGPEGARLLNNPPTNPPARADQPLMIAFAPGGHVLYYNYGGRNYAAGSPLYLSIGKRELVEGLLDNSKNNLGDFETYWVAVSNQTGLVSIAENAGVRGVANPLNESRDFVRKALSVGGR